MLVHGDEYSEWPTPTCEAKKNDCYISKVYQRHDGDFDYKLGDKAAGLYTKVQIDKSLLRYLPKRLLTIFNNVNSLTVNFCGLVKVKSGIFRGSNKITFLSIAYNEITHIDANNFDGLDNLETLSLSYNQIKYVDKLAFSNLRSVAKLYAYHNEIEYLHPDTFRDCLMLNTLQLGNNKLKTLEFIPVIPAGNLVSFSLRENLIPTFDLSQLLKFTKLRVLDFHDNCLRTVDLSKTRLDGIAGLWMQQNYLTEVSLSGLKNNFPKLEKISIEQNNFNCSHIRDITSALTWRVQLEVSTPSTNKTNVKGIACFEKSSSEDNHPTDGKCLDESITTAENPSETTYDQKCETTLDERKDDVEATTNLVQSLSTEKFTFLPSEMLNKNNTVVFGGDKGNKNMTSLAFLIISFALNVGFVVYIALMRYRKKVFYRVKYENRDDNRQIIDSGLEVCSDY